MRWNYYLLGSLLLVVAPGARAQLRLEALRPAPVTDSCCAATGLPLTQYVRYVGPQLQETGIIVRRHRRLPCLVEVRDSVYRLCFSYDSDCSARLSLPCALYPPGRPLANNRVNGQRVGLWLKWYPWGSIRRASSYQYFGGDGEWRVEVYFRPNGKPLRVNYYRWGRRSSVVLRYTKKEGWLRGSKITF